MKRLGARTVRPGPVACLLYTREEPPAGVTRMLFELGYTVVERAFSPSFTDLMREFDPDLLLAALDPLEPGDLEVLRFLAAHADDAALLTLSVSPGEEALEAALTAGADAVLPVTARPTLVGAQVAALQRRMGLGDAESRIVVGELAIDTDRRSVSHLGQPVELTRSEFDILALLARNAGRVLTPVEILSGIGQFPTSEAQARGMVKVHLSHLRQKLGQGAAGDYIATVRGVGYAFERPERPRPAPPQGADGNGNIRAMA